MSNSHWFAQISSPQKLVNMEVTIIISIAVLFTLVTFFVIWFQWTLLMTFFKKATKILFQFFLLSCIIALFANAEEAPVIIKGLCQVVSFFLKILITLLEELVQQG